MFVVGQFRKMPIYDCPKNAVYTSPYTQKKELRKLLRFATPPASSSLFRGCAVFYRYYSLLGLVRKKN